MHEAWIIWPDQHYPHHDPRALAVAQAAVRTLKPHGLLSLGDGLDCKSFSSHPAKSEKEADEQSPWDEDLAGYAAELKAARKHCRKVVALEGNHENRVKRKILESPSLKACRKMILPEIVLGPLIDEWVPYGPMQHYRLTTSLWACHGWHAGKRANDNHLADCTTFSIMHGHTHHSGHMTRRDPASGATMQAWSFGNLYIPAPEYTHAPTRWTHGFGVVYINRAKRRHDVFACKIENGCTVLPDGREVKL